jgi:hypothetical protein
VPSSRDEADVLRGVGLLVIGRGHRDHGAAEHPAEVARPAPVGELDAVATQLGRRALMLAAVPFADPLIERPAPADRAREGIESYLEPDRMGHDPGDGDRCLLASTDQLLNRQHRTNPPIGGADPIRHLLLGSLQGRRRLQIIKNPHGKRSPALSTAAPGAR